MFAFGRKVGMGKTLETVRLEQEFRTGLSGFWPLVLKGPEGWACELHSAPVVPLLAPPSVS